MDTFVVFVALAQIILSVMNIAFSIIIDNREISLESQELVARLYQDIVNLINIIENNENLEVL